LQSGIKGPKWTFEEKEPCLPTSLAWQAGDASASGGWQSGAFFMLASATFC